MSKKAVLVLFAVCTLISVHPALASQSAIQGNIGSRTASQNAVFTDVASTYWAYPSIIELADHGIISGFPNGAFRPEGAITRAEFAKIIDLAFDLPASTTTGSSFSDIDYTYWAFKYIEAAKSSGVITGLPNKTFQADRRITRAEIAKMVISAGKFKINKSGTAFIDTADNWAHDYIMTARNLGIIGGYANNTFDPSRSATRAEAAKIIANSLIAVLGTKADNPDIPSIRITSPTNKDELTTADNTLQLAGTATDDKEITRVTWANGQGSEGVAKGTTSWTIPSIMLREGLNSITITAIDNTGNMATAVIRVTYTQRSGDYMDSAFAATIPTIDGVINPGEWPDPGIDTTITYRDDITKNSESHKMYAYFKNDSAYLYIAVKIIGDDFEGDGFQNGDIDVLDITFDANNNDKVDTNEDEKHFWNLSYVDLHALADSSWGLDDRQNGEVRATHSTKSTAGDYVYELKLPLAPGDAQDVAPPLGGTVGVCIGFEEWHYDPTTDYLGSSGDWSNSSWPSLLETMRFGTLRLANRQ